MPDRCDVLALQNPHPRDERVRYVDETHTYFLDGRALPLSVSGLWARYFPHFDADGPSHRRPAADRVSRCLGAPPPRTGTLDKYFDIWAVDPKSKYHTLIRYLSLVHNMDATQQREEIKRLWNANGADASDAGTCMHRDIEFHLNGLAPEAPDTPEFAQFREWRRTFMADAGLQPYRTEFSIYDEDADLAGQIDCLMRTADGKYVMVDWSARAPGVPSGLHTH